MEALYGAMRKFRGTDLWFNSPAIDYRLAQTAPVKKGLIMKLYSSFLLRCWVIREEGAAERFVFDLEHIQTGEHWRAQSPESAFAQIMQTCQQPAKTDGGETTAAFTQEPKTD